MQTVLPVQECIVLLSNVSEEEVNRAMAGIGTEQITRRTELPIGRQSHSLHYAGQTCIRSRAPVPMSPVGTSVLPGPMWRETRSWRLAETPHDLAVRLAQSGRPCRRPAGRSGEFLNLLEKPRNFQDRKINGWMETEAALLGRIAELNSMLIRD